MYTHTHTHTHTYPIYICIYTHTRTYTHTVEYYSAMKKEQMGSFVVVWIDLESVIQSEVSQKEKNKCCILTHICGIYMWNLKNDID